MDRVHAKPDGPSRTEGVPPPSPLPGWHWVAIATSDRLMERAEGLRFQWRGPDPTRIESGFVVRVDGQTRAFVNACRHVPVELDWEQGRFFDAERLYLTCTTHGALYDPVDGRCVAGPCRGKALARLESCEHDGKVWILSNEKV